MNTDFELVLNWHITEACNYDCGYCFSKYETKSSQDLVLDAERTSSLLRHLFTFFAPGNDLNPLWSAMHWTRVRINIAGGEPLVRHRHLKHLITTARSIGFDVSLITNASRTEPLAELLPHLTWLGVSIDTYDREVSALIGRADRRGKTCDVGGLVQALHVARASHPMLHLKMNTVVNRFNHMEDFTPLLTDLRPDKWKVLRMLPIVTNKLGISDAEYSQFVARHEQHVAIMRAEDHQEMRQSYLMIDPLGRFYQNGRSPTSRGHIYSRPILEVGAAAAFAETPFDADRFKARYVPSGNVGAGDEI